MTGLFRAVGRSLAAGASIAVVVAFTACTSEASVATAPYEQVDGGLPAETTEQLDAVLAEAMGLAKASGAIAGVWAPWAGEWTTAVGTDGTDDGAAPLTTDTPFRIGTQSESFACAVLLSLVDEGKVDLSDDVVEYVDRVPGLDGITLGQLCHHTSGLGDYYSALTQTLVDNPGRNWPQGEVLASGLASTRTGAPGEGYSASRTDAVLLALALEQATGSSYARLVDQYVTGPLQLDDTTLPSGSTPPVALGGWVAARGADGAPICDAMHDMSSLSTSAGGPAAGMVSTLDDMHTWAQASAAGVLVSESTASDQWAGAVAMGPDAPSWKNRALGADVYGPMRGWVGDVPGTLSASFTEPKTGLTVVVALDNSTAGPAFVQQLAFALASIGARVVPEAGGQPPLIALPWSADQALAAMRALEVCPPPVA